MRSIWQDVRYALRQLRMSPGFAFTTVAVLALGLGANIAVFTLLNGIILRPLPYAQPDRIVLVSFPSSMPFYVEMAYADMLQLRDAAGHGVEIGAAFNAPNASISGPGGRVQVERTGVDAGMIPLLGVNPIVGRVFRPEENDPGRNREVLLGEDVWRRLYNSDPHIAGKTLSIRGETYTILGVMPRSFSLPFGDSLQIWTPEAISPAARSAMDGDKEIFGQLFARVPAGMTTAQLEDAMSRAQARIAKEVSESGLATRVKLSEYQESLNKDARKPLMLLYGVVFGIWALACLNVTSLMMARAVSRTREQAVRSALGASRV
ncbi:MAG: ABC transporter permease, partial [Terracidiphilus sp.]